MRIRSVRDLGALVRDHRRRQDLSQDELARRIGASRQWLIDFERGKPTAEVGLALKTLAALDIALDASRRPDDGDDTASSIDLDAHLDQVRGDE